MSIIITDLTFEHHTDALGVGESKPRLSWRFSGDAQDWIQDSYELEIQRETASTEAQTTSDIYRVSTAQSVLVPWPSSALLSQEEAIVRVRSFGNGIETSWSEKRRVEAGLLHPEDWKASLIEAAHEVDASKPHPPTLFRKSFQLDEKLKVQKARLHITAHGVYEAEINGCKVGDHVLAPGWTVYQHELPYQTFDITEFLRSRVDNTIGVHVAEGWYCGRLGFEGGMPNIWGSKLGVIAQLTVTYEDGSINVVNSDSSWKYNDSPISSSSIYDGETYNLIKEHLGWSSTSFNDSTWRSVNVEEYNADILRSPDGPPIRATQIVPVVNITKSPSGKTILDFGQNLVGFVRFKVPEGPKGHEITLTHTEVLEHGECATRPLRKAKAMDTLILPESGKAPEYWQPRFTFHGFRYVQLNNWPKDVDAADFTAIVIHTDMKKTGYFESSNNILNRLHENVTWSMRGNFVGIPTDCPQRDERLGWTGDIQAFASTASFLYNCQGMLKSWLRNLAFEQKDGGNGSPPVFSPNTMRHLPFPLFPLAIWGDATILVPWDLYLASGDASILSAQFDSMIDWIEKGIPRNDKGLWGETRAQLGDWLDPIAPAERPGHGSTDAEYVANAFLVRITDVMSQICKALGHKDKSEAYSTKASSLREAFAAEYITQTGRVMSDSQTAIALAIHFSLFPTPAQQEHAVCRLENLICVRSRFKIATGFAGTPILGLALSKAGKSQLFYRVLMNTKVPSFLYPVTMGATTIWERWDSMLPDGTINPGEMTSFNHYALGAVADWMHSQIGGLQTLEPGWRCFRIAPTPGGRLTHASVSFESPFGRIYSGWKIEGDDLVLECHVPPNTSAEIHLGADGVRKVGSGKYTLRTKYTEPVRPSLPPPLPFTTEDDDLHSLT